MTLRSLTLITVFFSTLTLTADDRPNVLFIAVDDLNHWVSHLGRNSQAKTPNIDRLAAMGTTFTNAHTAVPACEPSRCALMSGRRPWVSGCYKNGHEWRKYQKPGEGLSAQFLKAGYYVSGAGKIYHQMDVLNEEWSDYMDKGKLFSNGPGVNKYDGYHIEKTFPDLKDEDIVDWHSVDYCVERLSKKRKKPYFIACGLYKPHLAFVAPRKYYDNFPLDKIKLPPHIENDLDDIPQAGIKMANPNKDVIAFVGDGSYLLYNSDIYSSVITNNKLIIIVCDNGGHAVINRLQLFKGGKEYNCLLESSNTPNLVGVDFAKHAESMGAKSEQVNSISELEEAFKRAKKSDVTYVISIKTHSYQWLEGSAYWESPTLEIPNTKENEEALKLHKEGKAKQRQGV